MKENNIPSGSVKPKNALVEVKEMVMERLVVVVIRVRVREQVTP